MKLNSAWATTSRWVAIRSKDILSRGIHSRDIRNRGTLSKAIRSRDIRNRGTLSKAIRSRRYIRHRAA